MDYRASALCSPLIAYNRLVPMDLDREVTAMLAVVGRNLRAERARANMTQETLAHEARISVAQLARMERGTSDTALGRYLRVARALNIEPDVLLQGVR